MNVKVHFARLQSHRVSVLASFPPLPVGVVFRDPRVSIADCKRETWCSKDAGHSICVAKRGKRRFVTQDFVELKRRSLLVGKSRSNIYCLLSVEWEIDSRRWTVSFLRN